ncbi:basement membrane proteoglycan isoform X5 [Lepeophtheirus salmonis]|uniref:basement membrane proteoglycan isoform X5 n=1 Tax=Lepeophtheirus salmonis TaxID=72036 RepID=UPI001AE73E64|nr:basement membrane proteoglycan-like isoform X5 [Lepeophtheirus salmonis]
MKTIYRILTIMIFVLKYKTQFVLSLTTEDSLEELYEYRSFPLFEYHHGTQSRSFKKRQAKQFFNDDEDYSGDLDYLLVDDEEITDLRSTITTSFSIDDEVNEPEDVFVLPSQNTFIRLSIVLPGWEWKSELLDQNSNAFRRIERKLITQFDKLFDNVSGQQTFKIIKISKGKNGEPLVFLNLIVSGIANLEYLNKILSEKLESGKIGKIIIRKSGDYWWKKINKDNIPKCNEVEEFQCSSGDCVKLSGRCDEIPDCLDESDETFCNKNNDYEIKCENGCHDDICSNQNNECNRYESQKPHGNLGCRADTQITCPKSLIKICHVQKCDGEENCPKLFGESISWDEKNCEEYDKEDYIPGVENSLITNKSSILQSVKLLLDIKDVVSQTSLPKFYFPTSPKLSLSKSTFTQYLFKNIVYSNLVYIQPIDTNIILGSDLNLSCDVNLTDTPFLLKYHWSHNSSFELSQNTDQLFIPSVGMDDAGVYSCSIITEGGQIFRSNDVTVTVNMQSCNGVFEFKCKSGRCLNISKKCNYVRDCLHGDDEFECGSISNCSTKTSFLCLDGTCISEKNICDGKPDCFSREDEKDCIKYISRCEYHQFMCLGNLNCVPLSKKCDGFIDCEDESDERDCLSHDPHIKIRLYPTKQTVISGQEVVFQCRDEGRHRLPVVWNKLRDDGSFDRVSSNNGRLEIFETSIRHAGVYFCEVDMFTNVSSISATLNVIETQVQSQKFDCQRDEATCSNGQCIPKDNVCDGRRDCFDGSDESSCGGGGGCEPNEYRCDNKRCILKTWVCDSDDDCGDGSDENYCAVNPPGSPCKFKEWMCHSKEQCIPKSFHCDGEIDCQDTSDEIGCTPPKITQSPPPRLKINYHQSFIINCTAVGIPPPEIVWRLNWGHVPKKCKMTSTPNLLTNKAFGELNCPLVTLKDQGAYSCEAINSKGSCFAGSKDCGIPGQDVIIIVEDSNKLNFGEAITSCQPGTFHSNIDSVKECIRCYCSGITNECSRNNFFKSIIDLSKMDFSTFEIRMPSGPVELFPSKKRWYYVQNGFRIDEFDRGGNSYIFVDLSNMIKGSQVKSYGGFLSFNVRYDYDYDGPFFDEDVILQGNNITLYHRIKKNLYPSTNNSIKVRFLPQYWSKNKYFNNLNNPSTREDFMLALSNIQHLMIKGHFGGGSNFIENIKLDTAERRDAGFGIVTTIEKCDCPYGYSGLSCEECVPGFTKTKEAICVPLRDATKPVEQPYDCHQGYYYDKGSCTPCNCPLDNYGQPLNCYVDFDENVNCDCVNGSEGRLCEICSLGYVKRGEHCIPEIDPKNKLRNNEDSEIEGHIPLTALIQNPKSISKQLGQSAKFKCSIVLNDQPVLSNKWNITWTKEDIFSNSLLSDVSRYSVDSDGYLKISKLIPSDSGSYICSVSNGLFTFTDTARLFVQNIIKSPDSSFTENNLPPEVYIQPSYVEVVEGESAEFLCTVSNGGEPMWTKDSYESIEGDYIEGTKLYFQSVSLDQNENQYYCTSSNKFGTNTQRAIIYVKPRQTVSTTHSAGLNHSPFLISPQNKDIIVGQELVLVCQPNDKKNEIIWSKIDGTSIDISHNYQKLIISNIQPEHSGTYECLVRNPYTGTVVERSEAIVNVLSPSMYPTNNDITVNIYPDRQIVEEGSKLAIQCNINGIDSPLVEWSKADGTNLLANSRFILSNTYLTISDIQLDDRGVYICTLIPDGYRASMIIEVEKTELPKIEIFPSINQTIVKTGSVLFQCRLVKGIPTPVIEWKRVDGYPLPVTAEMLQGGVIRFNNVNGNEEGQYKCIASNKVGIVEEIVTLTIQEGPTIVFKPRGSIQKKKGEQFSLVCDADGDPTPTISLRKIGSDQNTLQLREIIQGLRNSPGSIRYDIESVSEEDEGSYICKATNTAGEVEEIMQLIVLDVERESPNDNQYYPNLNTNNTDIRSKMDLEAPQFDDRRPKITSSNLKDNIKTPPFVKLTPDYQVVNIGESAFINCSTPNHPYSILQWKKQGMERISSNVQIFENGILQFSKISIENEGRYFCIAENPYGRFIGTAEIIVEVDKITISWLESVLYNQDGSEGSNLSYLKIPEFLSTHQDESDQISGDSEILSNYTSNLYQPECSPELFFNCKNEGGCIDLIYKCDGEFDCTDGSDEVECESNGISIIKDTEMSNLRITSNFNEVLPGSSFEFECIDRLNRFEDPKWTKEDGFFGTNVFQDGHKLIFLYYTTESAGSYTCSIGEDKLTYEFVG